MTKRHWLFASAVLALLLGTSVGFASAKPLGAISVTDSTTAAASAGMTSHFTASGCGFREKSWFARLGMWPGHCKTWGCRR